MRVVLSFVALYELREYQDVNAQGLNLNNSKISDFDRMSDLKGRSRERVYSHQLFYQGEDDLSPRAE